jgi:hypothetical protein
MKILARTRCILTLLMLVSFAPAQQAAHAPARLDSRQAATPITKPVNNPSIDISVEYGAQLLLIDSQGRKSGYDPATGQVLDGIPGAVYVNDSITDATDNSPDAAEAESRVLDIQSQGSEQYSLTRCRQIGITTVLNFPAVASMGRQPIFHPQSLA